MKQHLFEDIFTSDELFQMYESDYQANVNMLYNTVISFMEEILAKRIEKIDSNYFFELAVQLKNITQTEIDKRLCAEYQLEELLEALEDEEDDDEYSAEM